MYNHISSHTLHSRLRIFNTWQLVLTWGVAHQQAVVQERKYMYETYITVTEINVCAVYKAIINCITPKEI